MSYTINIPVEVCSAQSRTLTLQLGTNKHVNGKRAEDRVKKVVNNCTGIPTDTMAVGARWSSNGSEHSAASFKDLPEESAGNFVNQLSGRYVVTVPSVLEALSTSRKESQDRLATVEKHVVTLLAEVDILKKESKEFRKIARRHLLDKGRQRLAADAGLQTTGDWGVSFTALAAKGVEWFQERNLSMDALVLTWKGKGSEQSEGDKAAHRVRKALVRAAVEDVEDVEGDMGGAWMELYRYVEADLVD